MAPDPLSQIRAIAVWMLLALVIAVPLAAAATSPYLAWRQPVYVGAGFAGIVALSLVLLQPLLAGGHLPGLRARRGRRIHRLVGSALVAAVVLHVAGLWMTSPPDVIDALTFRSATPFSTWGMIAMVAAFCAAGLALLRRPMRLRPRIWQVAHVTLGTVIAVGSVIHALLIVGTMETVSKAMLCILVLAAATLALRDVLLRGRIQGR